MIPKYYDLYHTVLKKRHGNIVDKTESFDKLYDDIIMPNYDIRIKLLEAILGERKMRYQINDFKLFILYN